MADEIESFWCTANNAFSKKERRAYNKWRHERFMASDELRDCISLVDFVAMNPECKWAKKRLTTAMIKAMNMLSKPPLMIT
jgi:hypothetical protein